MTISYLKIPRAKCFLATVLGVACFSLSAIPASAIQMGGGPPPPPMPPPALPPTTPPQSYTSTPNSGASSGPEVGSVFNFNNSQLSQLPTFAAYPDGGPNHLTPQYSYTIPTQPTAGLEIDNMSFEQQASASLSFSFARPFSLSTASQITLGIDSSIDVAINNGGTVTESVSVTIVGTSDTFSLPSQSATSSTTLNFMGTQTPAQSMTLPASTSYTALYTRTITWQPSGNANSYLADPGFDYAFIAPEPATVLLLGIGGLILPAYQWRRRKIAA
jgi:hypothetical protein